jgi:hypothetical protein
VDEKADTNGIPNMDDSLKDDGIAIIIIIIIIAAIDIMPMRNRAFFILSNTCTNSIIKLSLSNVFSSSIQRGLA